jgi:pectinesterase
VERKYRAYSDGTISTKAGSSIWYRFYNLEDNRPFFCDRDGIKVNELTLVSGERRSGRNI